MSKASKPYPLAIPHDLNARIDRAAKMLGRTKAQVIRDAMSLGLTHWERINYKVDEAVLDAALNRTAEQSEPEPKSQDFRLNEEPGHYKAAS